jgi:N-sulfoglucosamine sulfohydrolase
MHSNRTPLIIRWPGKTPEGETISQTMVNSIDLAPTILDIVGLSNLDGADGKSFRGLIDPAVATEGVGRKRVFVHLNYPFSRKRFAMRGLISMNDGYIWNGWANGKTKFSNESMSGRTFAAMAEAAKNDPTIAVRVSHYLYRCPEELFDYERDPDALNNLIDDLKAKPNLKASRSILLEHMKKTDDPEFKDYSVYLKSVRPVIDAIQDD